jgi:hypothetical protein
MPAGKDAKGKPMQQGGSCGSTQGGSDKGGKKGGSCS